MKTYYIMFTFDNPYRPLWEHLIPFVTLAEIKAKAAALARERGQPIRAYLGGPGGRLIIRAPG